MHVLKNLARKRTRTQHHLASNVRRSRWLPRLLDCYLLFSSLPSLKALQSKERHCSDVSIRNWGQMQSEIHGIWLVCFRHLPTPCTLRFPLYSLTARHRNKHGYQKLKLRHPGDEIDAALLPRVWALNLSTMEITDKLLLVLSSIGGAASSIICAEWDKNSGRFLSDWTADLGDCR